MDELEFDLEFIIVERKNIESLCSVPHPGLFTIIRVNVC